MCEEPTYRVITSIENLTFFLEYVWCNPSGRSSAFNVISELTRGDAEQAIKHHLSIDSFPWWVDVMSNWPSHEILGSSLAIIISRQRIVRATKKAWYYKKEREAAITPPTKEQKRRVATTNIDSEHVSPNNIVCGSFSLQRVWTSRWCEMRSVSEAWYDAFEFEENRDAGEYRMFGLCKTFELMTSRAFKANTMTLIPFYPLGSCPTGSSSIGKLLLRICDNRQKPPHHGFGRRRVSIVGCS